MGLLSKIFGSDNMLKKAAEGVYDGADAVFFTPEEKAKYFLDLLKAYEPFRLIQRVMASLVTVTYLGIWVISAIIFISSIFTDPCVPDTHCRMADLQEVSRDLSEMNNETLGLPFATIMALYFGGGMLNGALRAKNDK